jgi:hypothetical protein
LPLLRFGNIAIVSIAGWLARETEVWEKGSRREGKESKVGREKRGGEVGCVKKKNEACKTAYSCADLHVYPEGAKPCYCIVMQSCK